MSERRMCRHCANAVVSRPRGLCWACFHTPGVKQHYPPVFRTRTGKVYDMPEVCDFVGDAPLPERTDTLPGTEERLRVFEDRAARRLALFHPDDPAIAMPGRPRRVTVRVVRAAAGSAVPSRDILAGCGLYRIMGDFR
jgi:hypothetical protein